MKKILIVDWLDKYGGAERVISKMQDIFSFDALYTLVNVMDKEDVSKIQQAKTLPIHQTALKYTGKRFRWFFPLFFFFIGRIKVPKDTNLIISSSHSVAKGIKKTNKKQIHISYFQAKNSNYIWDETDLYFKKWKYLLYPIIYLLRKIDKKQAQRPDYIVCNSVFVQQWIKENYQREATVIYPPIDLSSFSLSKQKEDFYVVVGRLAKIKRFDIVIKTFNKNGKKLIVIGDGEERKNLEKLVTSPKISFTGFLETQEISSYIAKAKGFIQMGVEGFGIAPIEAQACGTPVIAYAKGGVLETVIDKETGVFFYEQSESELTKSIEDFEKINWDYEKIRQQALFFSEEKFTKSMRDFVAKRQNSI